MGKDCRPALAHVRAFDRRRESAGGIWFQLPCAVCSKPGGTRIPGASCQRVRGCRRVFPGQAGLVRERDRLRTLFDITKALVSKLSPDELFAAISAQLSKVIRHDFAVLTLTNEKTGDWMLLRFISPALRCSTKQCACPPGMPSAEALATGKPVVAYDADLDRYPSPHFRRFMAMGCKSECSVPLITGNGTIGTLEIVRTSDDAWTDSDVEFLVQVAGQVAIAVENALSYRELSEMKERLATEKLYLEDEIRLDHNIGNMVGEGPAFQSVLKGVQTVAPSDATVLILGETGTGKELVARAIHELSQRSKGSFVKVNCAAIPASLLESELFGHEKGAFTGAAGQRIGRFELAHQGTLFLDEIGEMPLELQPKLLRAIQDHEFERVGGNRTIRTDARFVAATNRDLKQMVEENDSAPTSTTGSTSFQSMSRPFENGPKIYRCSPDTSCKSAQPHESQD